MTTIRPYTKISEEFRRVTETAEVPNTFPIPFLKKKTEISAKVSLFTHFIWAFRFSRSFNSYTFLKVCQLRLIFQSDVKNVTEKFVRLDRYIIYRHGR